METSGFFNALVVDGVYDRKYNADDYCDNLAVVISDGVLRTTIDDLKVTSSGMVLTVGEGRAWIKGHWYHNDSSYSFSAISAPTGGARWDRVILRFDNSLSNRKISLAYLQGTAATTPIKPTLTRTNTVYELCLADVYVTAGATSVTVTDKRADTTVCGWVYSTSGDSSFFTSLDNSFNTWFSGVRNTLSSVTLFKRYTWRTVLTSSASSVAFSISQYDPNTCSLDVFVNGMIETLTTDYTVSGSVITFTGTLTAGTEIEVKVWKSVDGTGITTVSEEITQLQNQYATLSGINKFTYVCTGLNDNIALSQIAKAFYDGSYTASEVTTPANNFLTAIGGNTYLAALSSDAQITINVVGRIGVTSAYAGDGTASSRYRYFSFGIATTNSKHLIFDFAKTEQIAITCAANTNNIIFYGSDLDIRNANVLVTNNGANCIVSMLVGTTPFGDVYAENCFLKILATGKAIIAQYGTFYNCVLHTKSMTDNSYCIDGISNAVIKLIGCSMGAYTGTTSKVSACINVDSGQNAKIVASSISCPTVAQSGYYQNYLCQSNGGKIYISGVISSLVSAGTAANRTIAGQI